MCCQGYGKEFCGWVEEIDYVGGVEDVVAADGDGGGGLDLEGCVVYETEFEGGVWERSVFSDEMVHCLMSVGLVGGGRETFDMKREELRSSGSRPGRQYPNISTAARMLFRSSSSYSRRSERFIFENGPTAKAM